MDGRRKRSPEFYMVRVDGEGKINWRGMVLTHIKDLDEEKRSIVIEEIRRLKGQGLGRDRIQKTIAEAQGVYVPEKVLRRLMRNDLEIDWSRSRIRGPYRDLRLRRKLYDRVRQLRDEGKSYIEIQKAVFEEFGIKLPWSQIQYWCRNFHRPDGNVKEVPLTSDIWWFLGLLVADGNQIIGYGDNFLEYKLKLTTKDEELVQKAKTVLPGYCYVRRERNGTLSLVVKSRELYGRFHEVRRLIGECKYEELIQMASDEGTKAFVRGLFDGDGSGLFPHLTSNDVNVLEFFRYALRRYNIETSMPILDTKKGTVHRGPSNRWFVVKKDVYCVFIYPEDYDRFFELFGSSLQRKRYHMRLSQRILQQRSSKYDGRSYLDEVQRRYENGENWAAVLVPLRKGVGASMMRKRK